MDTASDKALLPASGNLEGGRPESHSEGSPSHKPVSILHHAPPPIDTVAVKSAMKKHPTIVTAGDSSPEEADVDDEGHHTKKKKKALTWDEHAIEEHDQLRGTRMKIDEPNTPYTHYEHHSDEESASSGRHPRSPSEEHGGGTASLAMHWDSIESKLQTVAAARDACPSSPSVSIASSHGSVHSDTEEEKRRREAKHKEFELHRRAHYNEMEALRKYRMEHPGGDDDNDDDDDDEDMLE